MLGQFSQIVITPTSSTDQPTPEADMLAVRGAIRWMNFQPSVKLCNLQVGGRSARRRSEPASRRWRDEEGRRFGSGMMTLVAVTGRTDPMLIGQTLPHIPCFGVEPFTVRSVSLGHPGVPSAETRKELKQGSQNQEIQLAEGCSGRP